MIHLFFGITKRIADYVHDWGAYVKKAAHVTGDTIWYFWECHINHLPHQQGCEQYAICCLDGWRRVAVPAFSTEVQGLVCHSYLRFSSWEIRSSCLSMRTSISSIFCLCKAILSRRGFKSLWIISKSLISCRCK